MVKKSFSTTLLRRGFISLLVSICMLAAQFAITPVGAQAELNPNPPDQIVKLVFIHHSSGEN